MEHSNLNHSTVVLTCDTRVKFDLFHPLKMAAIGAAETFGFNENLGPRPNSPADNLNTTDTGRESFRTIIQIELIYIHLWDDSERKGYGGTWCSVVDSAKSGCK